MTHKSDFLKAFRSLTHARQPWRVFADFCELIALSWANIVDKDEAREARYLEVARQYTSDELKTMGQLAAWTEASLNNEDCDFLGAIFQELELANHWVGQFFTPYPIARMMVAVTLGDPASIMTRPLTTMTDPACGSGVMLIAAIHHLRASGLPYHDRVYCEGVDVDRTAAHMCFVQLSMLGVPATVTIGNTLSQDMGQRFRTPLYWWGTNPWRIRRWREGRPQLDADPQEQDHQTIQLNLF